MSHQFDLTDGLSVLVARQEELRVCLSLILKHLEYEHFGAFEELVGYLKICAARVWKLVRAD